MALYSLRCQNCHQPDYSTTFLGIGEPVARPCQLCGGLLLRVASFSFRRPMQEHFNDTVGKPVRSYNHFKSELSRKSDELSERLGQEQNFQPIDLSDKEACGVTDEGLDATRKARRDTGLELPSSTIIH